MTTASQGIWWPLLDSMGLSAHVCIPTQRHIYSTHIHVIQDKPKKNKELWEDAPLAERSQGNGNLKGWTFVSVLFLEGCQRVRENSIYNKPGLHKALG